MAILPGLARFLEKTRPDAAVFLNPLNTDARVETLTRELARADSAEDLARLEAEAVTALASNRLDARLFSLLGEINRLQGDEAGARAHIRQALSLSKTEIHALERSIVWALEDGRTSDAVSRINTLLRRWPQRFQQIGGALPAILSDPAGFAAIADTLRENAPWRSGIFSVLADSSQGLPLAERLLFELRTSPFPPTGREIGAVISGHVRQQDYQSAYRLFLFTLSEEERAYNGYVYNASFAPVSLGRPFDWRIDDRPGIEILRQPGSGSFQGRDGIQLRFLNAPLKQIGIQQMMLLPPGTYELSATVSGRALLLPKGLFWRVSCASGAVRELARLDLPEGTYESREVSTELVVPDGDCELQTLQLDTGLVAESWRFRYQGALLVHEVRIGKIAA